MEDWLEEGRIVVREDLTRRMGGRTYYLAERHTDKGIFGFWVDESWRKSRAQQRLNISK